MNYWPYTFIFILSCLVIIRGVGMLIYNLISNEPRSLGLNNYERWLYGITLSYLTTYLIYA